MCQRTLTTFRVVDIGSLLWLAPLCQVQNPVDRQGVDRIEVRSQVSCKTLLSMLSMDLYVSRKDIRLVLLTIAVLTSVAGKSFFDPAERGSVCDHPWSCDHIPLRPGEFASTMATCIDIKLIAARDSHPGSRGWC